MKKLPISLLCGIAAILVTIALYFTILGNALAEIICFVTLIGVVLAEAITTVYAYLSKGKPRRVAAAVVSAIMIPVACILSVVYIVNFPKGFATYTGWYFIFTIIVNVIAHILFIFDARKTKEDDSFQNARSNILGMRKIVKCIMLEPAAESHATALNALEEKLHFSNSGVIASQDEQIYNMLTELQNNISDPEFDTETFIGEIGKLVDTRNIMTSRNV